MSFKRVEHQLRSVLQYHDFPVISSKRIVLNNESWVISMDKKNIILWGRNR